MRPLNTYALALLLLGAPGVAVTEDAPAQADMPAAALPDSDLEDMRARGIPHTMINIDEVDMQINKIGLAATLDHNVANNSHTGNNLIDNDAFSGSTGFMTVIQNTGNNVIIQNATIINLSLQP